MWGVGFGFGDKGRERWGERGGEVEGFYQEGEFFCLRGAKTGVLASIASSHFLGSEASIHLFCLRGAKTQVFRAKRAVISSASEASNTLFRERSEHSSLLSSRSEDSFLPSEASNTLFRERSEQSLLSFPRTKRAITSRITTLFLERVEK
jgi:hypothetical protein